MIFLLLTVKSSKTNRMKVRNSKKRVATVEVQASPTKIVRIQLLFKSKKKITYLLGEFSDGAGMSNGAFYNSHSQSAPETESDEIPDTHDHTHVYGTMYDYM